MQVPLLEGDAHGAGALGLDLSGALRRTGVLLAWTSLTCLLKLSALPRTVSHFFMAATTASSAS